MHEDISGKEGEENEGIELDRFSWQTVEMYREMEFEDTFVTDG
jgi:hypothetical protein